MTTVTICFFSVRLFLNDGNLMQNDSFFFLDHIFSSGFPPVLVVLLVKSLDRHCVVDVLRTA